MRYKLLTLICIVLAILMCFLSCGDGSEPEKGEGNSDNTAPITNEEKPEADPFVMVLTPESHGILNGAIYFDGGEEYTFYFGDEGGALEGYTELGKSGDGCFELEDVIIPPGACAVCVLGANGFEYTEPIPKECLFDKSELFVFGILSDVHYNRYIRNGVDDAEISLPCASRDHAALLRNSFSNLFSRRSFSSSSHRHVRLQRAAMRSGFA